MREEAEQDLERVGSGLGHWDMKNEPSEEVCPVLLPPQMRQGQAFRLTVWARDASWRRGSVQRHGGSHLRDPSNPTSWLRDLPTMPTLAGHAGLPIHDVELAFCQVCEADADGGQDLHVIGLHDVAQEPHPKLLVERGGQD